MNLNKTDNVDLKARRNNIINLVNKIWYNENYIKKYTIINSFFI